MTLKLAGSAKDLLITKDFLLSTKTAAELYHRYAEHVPILDYHCHVPPDQIARDLQFRNLTHIWLEGDHYKWRAMRACGVDEKFCTGDASDWDKFAKWAAVVPLTLRNPLYHWTHMELKRPFGIGDRLLSPETAESIWNECNEKLQTPEFSCRGIINHFEVRLICTTDDPIDSLEHHQAVAADKTCGLQLLPAWRPDKAMAVDDPKTYNAYLDKLVEASGIAINSYDTLLEALHKRHDFFARQGCRVSDHGLEVIYAEDYTQSEVEAAFKQIRSGKALALEQILKLKSALLYEFALMDHAKGWVQQYHLGALRNMNTRMRKLLGPDTGYDSIGDFEHGRALGRFFDRLDSTDQLAKTIIYNLNPADFEVFASMLGNFQDGRSAGKMQLGSGWWFLDQLDGMRRQLDALSNIGLLSQFVGMLTDSRSFLSYPRHDYFRRLLCNLLGSDIENGLLPRDYDLIGNMLRDICYNNAVRYFGFDLEPA